MKTESNGKHTNPLKTNLIVNLKSTRAAATFRRPYIITSLKHHSRTKKMPQVNVLEGIARTSKVCLFVQSFIDYSFEIFDLNLTRFGDLTSFVFQDILDWCVKNELYIL